jgi:hypothetical protein
LAGIFDFSRNPDVPDDPDAWLITFSVITTNSTDDGGISTIGCR